MHARRTKVAAISLALTIGAGVMAVTARPAFAATTFVVNRIGDAPDNSLADAKCDTAPKRGKQCTLRAAIQEANDTSGTDTINFNITSANKVIAPASPLPPIIGRVTINAYSQSGTSANTQAVGNNAVLRIVLDGFDAGADAVGFDVQANKTVIRGLVIQRWDGAGIRLAGSGSTISGNFIGTTASGDAARGNRVGVDVLGSSHRIGGANPGARNVISGNGNQGVRLTDVVGTLIAGNYIGTNAAGTAEVENGDSGVIFFGGANNVVGTGDGGAPNVISGNEQAGVSFSETSNSLVLGNLIGTNATGTEAIGNGQDGILLQSSSSNTTGGTTAAQRNTVSANQVGISLANSDGNTVVGNRLGTKADGTGNLGNRFGGIGISGSDNQIGGVGAAGNIIANTVNGSGIYMSQNYVPVNNLIQGNGIIGNSAVGISLETGPHRVLGNSIVGNGDDGIQIANFSVAPTGVRMSGNVIMANGGLGIDLVKLPATATGVDPNDSGDGDGGANHLQNFPVISSAIRQANGLTTVTMSLNSTANTEFRIELFLAAPDPSGHGEAQALVGFQTITTNSSGNRSFTFQIAGLVQGHQLTATAINETTDDTSEFAQNRPVV